jgi:hypothetical protein
MSSKSFLEALNTPLAVPKRSIKNLARLGPIDSICVSAI